MTYEEAIEKANTKWWENATPAEVVAFQLYEELLCMPFNLYHKAVEDALGRPVWTHEFAFIDRLRSEFEGKTVSPSLGDIIKLAEEGMSRSDS